MQPAMPPQALTASLTSFIGWGPGQRRPGWRNCASDRSLRKPPPHWSWPLPTSDRYLPRRKASWSGCAEATSPKQNFATTSEKAKIGRILFMPGPFGKWGEDLRVDPLTPDLAVLAAPWH